MTALKNEAISPELKQKLARSGRLFDAHAPERMEVKHTAHRLCQQYNSLDEWDEQRPEILRRLLGKCGRQVAMQGPIQFNYGCNTEIGDSFFANFHFTVLDDAPVTIGSHVMIGPNVSIMASSHPLLYDQREALTYPDGHVSMSEYADPIQIGNHVWIACGVIVCGGVTIGDGAVIGAGSVVTRDIPAGWLACGVPCKPIRPITENDSCLSLL